MECEKVGKKGLSSGVSKTGLGEAFDEEIELDLLKGDSGLLFLGFFCKPKENPKTKNKSKEKMLTFELVNDEFSIKNEKNTGVDKLGFFVEDNWTNDFFECMLFSKRKTGLGFGSGSCFSIVMGGSWPGKTFIIKARIMIKAIYIDSHLFNLLRIFYRKIEKVSFFSFNGWKTFFFLVFLEKFLDFGFFRIIAGVLLFVRRACEEYFLIKF